MSLYLCPRSDLGCHETFADTGALDHHLRTVHLHTQVGLLWDSLRRARTVEEPPARRDASPALPPAREPAPPAGPLRPALGRKARRRAGSR